MYLVWLETVTPLKNGIQNILFLGIGNLKVDLDQYLKIKYSKQSHLLFQNWFFRNKFDSNLYTFR